MARSDGLVVLKGLAAFALFVFGAPLAAAGAYALIEGGTLAYDGRLLAVGGAMVAAAVLLVRSLSRAYEAEEAARPKPARPAVDPDAEPPVLARWTVDGAEWRAYSLRELRGATRDAAITFAGMLALGTLVMRGFTGSWTWGFAAAAGLATLGAGLTWLTARVRHREERTAAKGEIVVWPDGVEINGRGYFFADGDRRLGGARLLDAERPAVLEIVARRTVRTRNGIRTEEDVVRVPVPREREDEARALIPALGRALPAPGEDDEG